MSSSPRSGFCGGGCHPSSPRKTPCMGDGWGMGAISYVSRLDLRECLPRRTDGCEGDGTRLSRRLPVHGSQVTLDWQGLASGTMRDGVVARLTSRSRRGYGCNNMCGRTGCCRAMCWIKIYQFLSFVNLNPVTGEPPSPSPGRSGAAHSHSLTKSSNAPRGAAGGGARPGKAQRVVLSSASFFRMCSMRGWLGGSRRSQMAIAVR